jgi:hypothetical protein
LPIGGKHKALLAPDARLDPKAHLLQPGPDFEAEAAFARIDQNGDRRAGAEELRYFAKRGLDGPKRVLSRNQPDRVLSLGNAAGRGGRDANETAPPKCKV